MHFEFPEGATPLNDCSDLLLSWVHERADLNRVEAENISEAQRKYLRASFKDVASWFHFHELQAIHRAMFGNVWGWAGKLRKSRTSIGVAPDLIPLRIAELSKEVASWSTEAIELTFLEKSARIHHCLFQLTRIVKLIKVLENFIRNFSEKSYYSSFICVYGMRASLKR